MRRKIAMALALVFCLGLLAGCAKEQPELPQQPSAGGDQKPADKPVQPQKPAEPKVLKLLRSGEDTGLNPHDSSSTSNGDLVEDMLGRLYKYMPSADGKKAELRPEYADGLPETSDGGRTWTVKLRQDAQWPDGQKITADEWIYSFRMAMDPHLMYGYGIDMATRYVEIVNAEAYYKQVANKEEVQWEDVGIRKADDYTLRFELTKKYTQMDFMRQFQGRFAGLVRRDIYEKCLSADGTACEYGSSQDKVMFCGPYIIENWVKGTEITMVKNPTYVLRDLIHFDKIYSRVVQDESTRLELFDKGECDHIGLGTNGLAKYEEDPRTLVHTGKGISTIEVNQNNPEKPYLKDPGFRKALFYAIDRNSVSKLSHRTPAPYFISSVGELLPDGTTYRDYGPAKEIVPANGGYDPKLANQYLEEAFRKFGLTEVELTLHYNESNEGQRLMSEFLQAAYKDVFGGKVKLTLQATAKSNLLKLMRTSVPAPTNAWDLGWSGWALSAESFYPWKKAEAYGSGFGKRYTAYSNAELDRLLELAGTDEYRLDPQKLADLTVEMEKALYSDMTCIPVAQSQSHSIFSERVEPAMKVYVGAVGWGIEYGDFK